MARKKFGAISNVGRISEDPRSAAHNRQVNAIHPGPDADYVPPVARVETPIEKLARLEAEYLEIALSNASRYDHKAMRIVCLRAEITG